jgi:hypothetical protein
MATSVHLIDPSTVPPGKPLPTYRSMCGRWLRAQHLTGTAADVTCRMCRATQAYRAAMAS